MYFLVTRTHGRSWDSTRLRREQDGWDAHAAFMDELTADGFVVLGGPVGEGDGHSALLVVEADSEGDVRARLSADRWGEDMLRTDSIEPWSILLRRSPG